MVSAALTLSSCMPGTIQSCNQYPTPTWDVDGVCPGWQLHALHNTELQPIPYTYTLYPVPVTHPGC